MEKIEDIAKLAELEADLHAKNHQLKGYSARLAEADAEIAELRSAFKVLADDAVMWIDAVVEKQHRIAELSAELAKKDAEIERLKELDYENTRIILRGIP